MNADRLEVIVVTVEESIITTKQSFEDSFSEEKFYNKQTQDENHLKSILDFLPISPYMNILDLGVGSGYLSFAIAQLYPNATVVGLDIVDQTLKNNQKKIDEKNIKNLRFISYNGIDFPFDDNTFDLVVSRYALHHFPAIDKSLSEVFRVLTKTGLFFISDPAPNENDREGFIDEYMRVKKDGHIKFYSFEEWVRLCETSGFRFEKSFHSNIRFPRIIDSVYQDIMRKYDNRIIDGYDLQMTDNEIYITEQVNNMLFCRLFS